MDESEWAVTKSRASTFLVLMMFTHIFTGYLRLTAHFSRPNRERDHILEGQI